MENMDHWSYKDFAVSRAVHSSFFQPQDVAMVINPDMSGSIPIRHGCDWRYFYAVFKRCCFSSFNLLIHNFKRANKARQINRRPHCVQVFRLFDG